MDGRVAGFAGGDRSSTTDNTGKFRIIQMPMQKCLGLTEQTEKALFLLSVIIEITGRGNNVEIRRKKDGTLTVYEVKKNIITV